MTNPAQNIVASRSARFATALTLLLLGGIAYDQFLLGGTTADTEIYHERARLKAEALPFHFERWLGIDVPVPQAAVTLLKPNFIISRRYQEIGTGRSAAVVIVHCRDSRDILGHYPPVCYKNQGWVQTFGEPQDRVIGETTIRATRYEFKANRGGFGQQMVVDNFMILPNGQTAPDMNGVTLAAQDNQLKHFGAAQVQIVYPEGITEPERQEIFSAMVRHLMPLISTVQDANTGATKP